MFIYYQFGSSHYSRRQTWILDNGTSRNLVIDDVMISNAVNWFYECNYDDGRAITGLHKSELVLPVWRHSLAQVATLLKIRDGLCLLGQLGVHLRKFSQKPSSVALFCRGACSESIALHPSLNCSLLYIEESRPHGKTLEMWVLFRKIWWRCTQPLAIDHHRSA